MVSEKGRGKVAGTALDFHSMLMLEIRDLMEHEVGSASSNKSGVGWMGWG